jgi:PIN domain nuclease of toxin-antitoxin system
LSSQVVVDASAVLALLNGEPGAAVVERTLGTGCVISAVNLSEVAGKLIDVGLTQREVREAVGGIGLEVREFDMAQAYESGLLRSKSVSGDLALSLGDRACIALAITLGLPVLTADKAWLRLSLPVEVRVIR